MDKRMNSEHNSKSLNQMIDRYPWLKELSEKDRSDAIRRINVCRAIGAAVPDKLIHDRYKKKP